MGEVYRATDSNLKRSVAIKVLPAAMAGDADRLARFQREAEVLAALNHPNIAAIYGLERTPNLTALVMELVEGEDLSAQIARGTIPIAEALPIAKQIADALEAAHEQGIVHRDLKPANVKVRADGTVKVLDFGLAKSMDPPSLGAAGKPGAATNSPTMTSPAMTAMGMILGTAAYMSPEQAKGRVVDKRADIWAFGVVLYEMLSGRRAFEGEDVSDLLVAVLSKDVDLTSLPAETPPRLRALVRNCLVRDPKQRLRDIGDARLVLDKIMAGGPDDAVAVTGAAATARPSSRVLPWTVAGALAVALAIALWAPWRAASAPPSTALRLTPLAFEPGGQIGAVWSPDGKAVAYGARQGDTDPYQLYVRYLDSPVATQITTLAAGVLSVVQWTAAGKIVFFAAQRHWSISPVGGEPEPWAAVTWDTGRGKLQAVGLGSVSRDAAAMGSLYRGEDGVITLWTARPDTALKPYEPAAFASRSIINTPVVRFSPDGRQILLFRNTGTGEEAWLMPYPASADNPPHRVLQGVSSFFGTPTASWLPDNRHVVLSASPSAALRQLYLADTVSGTLSTISSGTTGQDVPAVSPDGSKLVFQETATDRDIVSVDLTTAVVTPVIATQRREQMPAWASRESALVYVTDRNGDVEIWMRKPGQPDRPLVTARDFPPGKTRGFMGPALSPDGTRVIYRWLELGEFSGLWMSAVSGGPPVRLVKGAGTDDVGSWSPDGNWYVYRHQEEGRESLIKVKTTGGAEPQVLKADVKRSGAWAPGWSPANDWILFGDNGVKLISPDGKTTREVSPTSALAYAFSADGRTIYGLRQPVFSGRVDLFSMAVTGGSEKAIGFLARDYVPAASNNPALRLSLAPDGKSLTYSIARSTTSLWLMDGLRSVTGK
jgi:Tol biopolymer transport system component